MPAKPKLAVYWASSCGGCEIALVNLHERFLEVDRHFDLVFCPCLMDAKVADVEALPDGAIAVTLFNGAIGTAENAEMARLLRRKSRTLVAFGACSGSGGIPALRNLLPRAERPGAPQRELELPELLAAVRTLSQTVEVDYFIPGCPPEPARIWEVVEAIVSGGPLPARRSVLGGGVSSVCAECAREREDKQISRLFRTHEVAPDASRCLLDQGLLCVGPATRDGCGALCPQVNMPCSGCYGPPDGVLDQGGKMIAALGSSPGHGATVADAAGAFYKFTLAGSLLGGRR